jgi:biotin carboxyl carrier protein
MKLRVTVEGKSYDVDVEILEGAPVAAPAPAAPMSAPASAPAAPPKPAAPKAPATAGGASVFPSPLAGTIRAIKVSVGDTVAHNQEILILEAMKMETPVAAPKAGRIKAILVSVGDAVQTGQALVEFE